MTYSNRRPLVKAVILSAGQGKRLLPLTREVPKCLLTIAGKSILEWQIDHLLAGGIHEVAVITGFGTEQVESLVHSKYSGFNRVHTVYNPFYNLSDNLVSCWVGRSSMDTDFLLLNGDTLFEPALLEHVMSSESAPITLTVDHKDFYDEDDMKVEMEGEYVKHVSKALPSARVHAESIGLLYFRESGPSLFQSAVEKLLRNPSGLNSWYLAVIDSLAGQQIVKPCAIDGFRWAEIDNTEDLDGAEALFSGTEGGQETGTPDEPEFHGVHRTSV